ncbi:MAG: carboxypeptidase M32 [Clostridiales bacterium]|nr:carboxypeptidase M32 [Clostridiales bacterium]
MNAQERKAALQNIYTIGGYYNSIGGVLGIDQWGGLPDDGVPYRLKVNNFLNDQRRALYFTPEAEEIAAYYKENPIGENDIETAQIRGFLKQRSFYQDVPKELFDEFNRKRVESMTAWKQAREKQDFNIFKPYMKAVFDLRKQIALALRPDNDPFATLVDMTDEGLNIDDISSEFHKLRQGIVEIRRKIEASGLEIDNSILQKEQNAEDMMNFAKALAREVGYQDAKGGYNDKVIHAFSSTIGPRDARISTAKHGKPTLITTILHESGHSMYGYSSNEEVAEAGLFGGISGGFHEGQARFIENFIGRSRAYIHHIYPKLIKAFPAYEDIPEEAYYRALNKVASTYKRTEADEVTYNLHVIIRFELERDYFAGKLTIDQMRDAWDDKYEEYLGIRPRNDTEGILQDMHWTGSWIGYFQSYTLGNIYDGMIYNAILKDIPNFSELVEEGEFAPIINWLTENIWQYGRSVTAMDLLNKFSDKGLDAQPLIDYLDDKFGRIYGWKK